MSIITSVNVLFLFFSSPDMKYNFDKIATLNQGTPYDYDSVMQYHRSVTNQLPQVQIWPRKSANAVPGIIWF